jgi:acetyl-CoA carboxylase biotin carboxyl carrier protein
MDLSYVKKLLKLVEESDVNEVELEEKGVKIRITKAPNNVSQLFQAPPVPSQSVSQPAAPAAAAPPQAAEKPSSSAPEKNYHEIKSPIVGTFYRAPAPDANNYVEVGSSISDGTILCIVEAMKLMNEIESDCAGKVVKIMVENGQPVEYGQVLFQIETA